MSNLLEEWTWMSWTEVTWPCHDAPAVWKSWGLRSGGLPVVESLPGAPATPPRYGALPDDGLPTLHVTQRGSDRG